MFSFVFLEYSGKDCPTPTLTLGDPNHLGSKWGKKSGTTVYFEVEWGLALGFNISNEKKRKRVAYRMNVSCKLIKSLMHVSIKRRIKVLERSHPYLWK